MTTDTVDEEKNKLDVDGEVARRNVRRIVEGAIYGNFGVMVSNKLGRFANRPRVLHKHPMPGRYSARRINRLLSGMDEASSYLEIGLAWGYTFENVNAATRWGVDPMPQFDVHRLPPGVHVHVGTSDEFFDGLPFGDASFDVVYLDGLHTFRQTYRDLINAFRLSPNAIVLMDDVVPADEISAIPDPLAAVEAHRRLGLPTPLATWQGDVFRVVLCLHSFHPELSFSTIEEPDGQQTLIWKTKVNEALTPTSESELRSIEAIEYGEVFNLGVPSYFRPTTEDMAIACALSGCGGENRSG